MEHSSTSAGVPYPARVSPLAIGDIILRFDGAHLANAASASFGPLRAGRLL
ncbi:hypothetical protein [Frigoribacterium sp. PhB160]|uniref:hypothetical protein n=1 Tax=Frigoribacterium sp. PhB160 TaxID=2485192 RepID=UPI0013152543|nr:hypothetical protein [Frigoribacterium sp. PhB160]